MMIVGPDKPSIEPSEPPTLANIGSTKRTQLSENELRRGVARLRFNSSTGEPMPYPALNTPDDLSTWSYRLESVFKSASIPKAQWADAAILFLEGPVNLEMRKRRHARKDVGWIVWNWEEYLVSLREVLVDHNAPSTIQQFREDHPAAATAATVAGTGLVIVGGAVLAPVVVVGGLNALGFTAAGVAGGSIAAGLQSAFYGGATTGLFSICQSIAATAAASAVIPVLSAAGSITAGATLLRAGRNPTGTGDSDASSGSNQARSQDPLDVQDSPPPPYHPLQ